MDVCIRSLSLKRTFASTAEGRRELASWLRRQKVGKAVMEASGGYERDWAKALRNAKIEVRIVDPKRVRSFAQSAGRLAKNDTIDAEMIAWFAETFDEARGQAYDATREQLHQMVNARQAMKDMQTKLESQGEHALPATVQRMHARIAKAIAVRCNISRPLAVDRSQVFQLALQSHRAQNAAASTASLPASVTIMIRPSCGVGCEKF